ncbi:DUF1254 domain-containing protein [Lysobacter sp. SG-8]|uniref:DUF1254 domain-containing protein n=1 Tax=Marilutibacter penaei TaxID=2759900 RepID=A0A7W3U3H9_9GAMM|nr:DUF1254 domain-containing protein [Lysobacter penaei]MBB1088243.1 DUF1254 domain-containing protein [Lysobacter penaei]
MKQPLVLAMALVLASACSQAPDDTTPTDTAAKPAPQASSPPPSDAASAEVPAGQVVAPGTAADVPKPVAGAPVSPEYAAAIGQMAYIWGWPLVNMHNRQTLFATAPHPGLLGGVLPVAPLNQLSMLSDYLAPEQRFVTSPNQDVVYGAGFLSLDKDAVVVQVPDFGDRFWVYQVVDQRSDSFAKMGIQYGTKPGAYLLAGPGWDGTVPDGIVEVYRSQTNLGAVFPRVFMDDTAEDREAIQPLIDQVMAYPLSEFTGEMRTTDWSESPTIPNPNAGGDGETQWVVPEDFFDVLPTVMEETPPLPGEEALYESIRFVLDAAQKNPELKKALTETAMQTENAVIAPMFEFRNNGVEAGSGWRTQKNAARFGFGYFQRTATAKGNMFSNVPDETMYFGADFDGEGERLNGANAYTVTFPAGQLPPVQGFWSLTLYNKQHFFHPNALNRFSLGTKNKALVNNPDGSLTLYVQATNPGGEKEANWLPAPQDDFSLYIRAYWPQEAITKGTWVPPTIERVSAN